MKKANGQYFPEEVLSWKAYFRLWWICLNGTLSDLLLSLHPAETSEMVCSTIAGGRVSTLQICSTSGS